MGRKGSMRKPKCRKNKFPSESKTHQPNKNVRKKDMEVSQNQMLTNEISTFPS